MRRRRRLVLDLAEGRCRHMKRWSQETASMQPPPASGWHPRWKRGPEVAARPHGTRYKPRRSSGSECGVWRVGKEPVPGRCGGAVGGGGRPVPRDRRQRVRSRNQLQGLPLTAAPRPRTRKDPTICDPVQRQCELAPGSLRELVAVGMIRNREDLMAGTASLPLSSRPRRASAKTKALKQEQMASLYAKETWAELYLPVYTALNLTATRVNHGHHKSLPC
ncbi:uncharacterized protein [Castor canadensis]|uniref:Uncharacterized protein n=1 Tax=Castor canadensis TaxID=51338 RepID=A0AC58KJP3_CASCN